jgi:hypothetical protein
MEVLHGWIMGLDVGIWQWCLIWVLRLGPRRKGRLRFMGVIPLPGRWWEVWLLTLTAVRSIILLGRWCVRGLNWRRSTLSMTRRRTRRRRRVVVLLVLLVASGILFGGAHDIGSMPRNVMVV